MKKSDVIVCSVIGYPLGTMSAKAKVYEVENAVKNNAKVIASGCIKDLETDIKYINVGIDQIKTSFRISIVK